MHEWVLYTNNYGVHSYKNFLLFHFFLIPEIKVKNSKIQLKILKSNLKTYKKE